jgi:hypothetical protein
VSAGLLALAVLASFPDAAIVLEVTPPPVPGEVAEAAPPRFVLMDDGTVYVGGTGEIASARLTKDDTKDIDRQLSRLRKLGAQGPSVTFGAGSLRYHLVIKKTLDVIATGDPNQAPATSKPLAALVETLANFDHPALRPWKPAQYALQARPSSILGGCRSWTFSVPLPEAVGTARSVPADAVADWPTGAAAASVCSGDKTYIVTLRPLLPGERP